MRYRNTSDRNSQEITILGAPVRAHQNTVHGSEDPPARTWSLIASRFVLRNII